MNEEIHFVKLPFLSVEHSVGDAALALKFADRRAAVVDMGGKYRLLSNRQIVKALEDSSQKLATLMIDVPEPVVNVPNISTSEPLMVTDGHVPLDLPRLGTRILKAPTPKSLGLSIGRPAGMGLIWKDNADAGLVILAGTNETILRALQFGAKACKCQNPTQAHYDPAPPAGPGRPCTRCPYTYVCY